MAVYTLIIALALTASVEACFPAKYWISCLIDTCKLGGRCPGDPTAECKMEKTECDGCKPVWYTKTGQKANCGVQRNLKLCPGGEPVVHCKVDSCKWPCTHPDFKNAQCRQSYCGECKAEYFIKDAWVSCPVTTAGAHGEVLPIDSVVGDSCIKVPCSIDICIGQRCPAAPGAVCRPDGCNTCSPAWYLDNKPVDCITGAFINQQQTDPIVSPMPPWQRACAAGVPLVPCDMKVCDKKICRNFPDAVCRPDGCGGCQDTWYVDNKLVDCLSDACPPRVPIVKCVDDPCKYFGHYCPTAECRASQCGKCEAKFFSNGQEIDCVMPPKECPVGVEARTCPWYTCPANICPSNRRLMCRIDPCGTRCTYQFIDIYNGEEMLCRVFDGDGRRRGIANNVTSTESINPPKFVDLVPDGSQSGIGLPGANNPPQTTPIASQPLGLNIPGTVAFGVNVNDVGNSVNQAGKDAAGQSAGTNSGRGFNVEPVFLQPGPPIQDPDILSLLRAFPHEVAIIPTSTIQSALKQNPPSTLGNAPLFEKPPMDPMPISGNQNNQQQSLQQPTSSNNQISIESMKPVVSTNNNVVNNQLLDLTGLEPKQISNSVLLDKSVSVGSESKPNNTPLYPELQNLPRATIAAGKPTNIDSSVLGLQQRQQQQQQQRQPANVGIAISPPRDANRGVSVSRRMFSSWSRD